MERDNLTISQYNSIKGWYASKPNERGVYEMTYTIRLQDERAKANISVACKAHNVFVFGAAIMSQNMAEGEGYPCSMEVTGNHRTALAEYLKMLIDRTKCKDAIPLLKVAIFDTKQFELF